MVFPNLKKGKKKNFFTKIGFKDSYYTIVQMKEIINNNCSFVIFFWRNLF